MASLPETLESDDRSYSRLASKELTDGQVLGGGGVFLCAMLVCNYSTLGIYFLSTEFARFFITKYICSDETRVEMTF